MQDRPPITRQSGEKRPGTEVEKPRIAAIARQVEELPLRRDMVTLLLFVRDNKIIGTRDSGNMPLKAVREVTARFVDPPPLEPTIGSQTFRLRTEAEVWPLYFLHLLADGGGLITAAPARLWRLTAQGQRFLDADPMWQVPFLLAVWWRKVNWLVAYPYTGMGNALPPAFPQATLAILRSLPIGTDVSFDEFADRLIGDTGLTWKAQESRSAAVALHSSIRRMVINLLVDFGALECRFRDEPVGKGTIARLVAFKITPWGATLLDAVATVGG
jgi:hypothetical protein